MVADAVFFDLSSSDEDDEDHNQNRSVSADSPGLNVLSKVCNLHVEDDDVVIIDKPSSNDKVKRDKPRVIRSVMDDDECCMLDTDPGATETTECTPPLDSDELVMTGEKGPVACRDFPHARYLCVHFPFKTTPHANFCTQCHCYVCDSLAPCSLWGDGNSANDHCHASEESPWKTLRKLAKCRPVASSRPAGTATATATAQPAFAIPTGLTTGIANPTGVSKFVTVSSMLQTHATSPISPVVAPIPAGLGVSQRTTARVYSPGLVISLRGKGRGKPSQPQHHLGVARSPKPHRSSSTVMSGFSGNNNNRPLPRSPSAPSGRITGDSTPAQVPRAPPIPQAPQHPQFTPYLSAAPLDTSGPLPALNTVPGTVTPPVNFPLAVGNSTAAYYYPFPAPPLPNSPPPYIPPPPPPCAYTPQPPAAYNYPSPGATVYDHYPMQQFPGVANTSVAEFGSDSRYVSALSDLQVKQYEDQGSSQSQSSSSSYAANYASSEYVAQDYRSPVVDYAGAGSGGGGPIVADILAGPIATEGWAADMFDTFSAGGVGADSHHQSGGVTSLEKVLEQMAGDDYLWEQFPCW